MLTFIDMQILRDLKLNANRNKVGILFLVTNLLDNIMGFKTVFLTNTISIFIHLCLITQLSKRLSETQRILL